MLPKPVRFTLGAGWVLATYVAGALTLDWSNGEDEREKALRWMRG
jgi:hypothetical protein